MLHSEWKYVGRNLPLHDGPDKVMGTIKYTGDMRVQGMLYAAILFSPHAHARIINLDVNEAKELPGVVEVFSYHNVPDITYNSQVWFKNQDALEDERLFADTVRYVGDRVAAVVAESMETAKRAINLIKVDYEVMPAILSIEDALAEGVFFEKEMLVGRPQEILAETELVVEDVVETPKIHHASLETHSCLAVPNHSGKITVYSPCQIMYSVRLIVAKVLGLPLNKVRVIKNPIGGSFGGKQEVILEPLCAYMAKTLSKPVLVNLDRKASIIATRTRTKTLGQVRTAVDQSGRILAREINVVSDTGAYTSNGAVITMAMGKKLFRLYRIENQRYFGQAVHTNTPVAGAARGYGSPQIHAITEINLDHVARKLRMDPLELRLKNLVQPGGVDPTGAPALGNARIIDCVIEGASIFGWAEKRSRPSDTGRYRRGVGMACATHGNGYHGAFHDFSAITLKMAEDGSMIANMAIHELGCGTITTMRQIIAEVMDIDPNRIEISDGDTENCPYDIGSQASRVTFVLGFCAMKAAEKMREMLIKEAAKILQSCPEQLEMQGEKIWVIGHPERSYSYGEIASLILRKSQKELIVTEQYVSSANPGSYGVNFAEVEVDIITGLVKVQNLVAVYDVGQAINPGMVAGQIHGGIQMGLGFALCEDIKVDEITGRVHNDTFRNYHIFNAPDIPDIKIHLIEKGEHHGPFGAKSIGEVATVPTAPAVVNAVNHALGTSLTSLPLHPQKIVHALMHLNQSSAK